MNAGGSLDWSPNVRWILFENHATGGQRPSAIWLMHPNGENRHSITTTAGGTVTWESGLSPAAGTLWKVGDVIPFSGSATDPIDGQLTASALTWKLILHHCPTDIGSCHTHDLQSWTGVSTGSLRPSRPRNSSSSSSTEALLDGYRATLR